MKVIAQTDRYSLAYVFAKISIFTFLMVLSANVRIPLFFSPVPITTQTLVLLLSVAFLGRWAGASQAAYVFMGAVGLPVFANAGAGLLYLFGPTGGYLLSFLVIAFCLPLLFPKKVTFLKMVGFFCAASIFILAMGASWMVLVHKVALGYAVSAGVLPFLIGDFIKSIIAAFVAVSLHSQK